MKNVGSFSHALTLHLRSLFFLKTRKKHFEVKFSHDKNMYESCMNLFQQIMVNISHVAMNIVSGHSSHPESAHTISRANVW